VLERLGWFTVRRRKWILAGSVVFLVVAGAVGGGVVDRMTGGGFEDPGAESALASDQLERVFNAGDPNLILLVTADEGSVDDKDVAAEGNALTKELAAEPDLEQVVSYWSLGQPPPLRSANGEQALVLARIAGDEDFVDDRVAEIHDDFTRKESLITVGVGGQAEVFRQVGTTIESDLQRAEAISLPLTLILLVLVFGSVVAASLPLGVGALALLGTFLVLRVITSFTDVSVYALNMTTAMSLGLAIDYSLFVVSRFREEMHNGLEPHDAVVASVKTAGRTVIFSGLTVAVSLAALMIFPLVFLRSFAYAGISVVAIAVLGAVLTLPALLAVLGHRVDKLAIYRRHTEGEAGGFWHRVASSVMKRPVVVTIVIVAILGVLGAPFFGINFGLPDDRVLPVETSSRQVQQDIRDNFNSQEAAAISVVAPEAGAPKAIESEITSYAEELSQLDGVSRVDAITGSYAAGAQVFPATPASLRFAGSDGTWLSVVPSVEPISPAAERLVKDVRAVDAPFEVGVSGPSAQLVDSKASIFSKVPIAGGLIALVTFTVLFLMFGSVLVPLKAVVLNLLSLTATFGAMVWIFQEGHFSGALDFTATGALDTTTPILMFCIAFGLSMDYEVFLLSRIKEEYDITGDNAHSVAMGLERTGRIVTAAAVLLAVVFIAFATSGIAFIKLFGVGLALAVLMDATLIRATLVPAFMKLAGNANWWAPAPLKRIYERFGISEGGTALAPEAEGRS
jgi:putative drug exporter of the RND superfamily